MSVFLAQSSNKRNMRFLCKFSVTMLALICLYTASFHYIMLLEGREFSMITGLYWTLTTMSTLGFGDITFESDFGRFFSIIVLFSGIILFMMMLPFIFIRFIYQPWLEAHNQSIVPHALPVNTSGHVLILGADDIALNVLERLRQFHVPSYIITPDQQTAIALFESGMPVMLGALDSSDTYLNAQVRQARLVVALQDNLKNTNIAATVRDVSPDVQLVASVSNENAADILLLAGCNNVFNFTSMLGRVMGRRVFAGKLESNIIASFDDLHIAEAQTGNTPLVGKSLLQLNLRAKLGVNVVGIWQGSEFMNAHPDIVIDEGAVLLIAGNKENLEKFDAFIQSSTQKKDETDPEKNPVLILGGGKVGLAVVENMIGRGIPFILLDKKPSVAKNDDPRFVLGDAEDINALRLAKLEEAHSIVITTHDDDLNIYLTLYCRKLRPEIQIIARCNLSRNIKALYSAGANLVMAISSLASHYVLNAITPDKTYMLTEGLNIFRVSMPPGLVGKNLRNSDIRKTTRCNVVAMQRDGNIRANPDPDMPFEDGDELIIIGSQEAEQGFLQRYPLAS